MVNNAVGYNVNELLFDSGNTSARTIGGNDLAFFNFGAFDPEIINNSTASHIINLNITGDNDNTFQIGANSGDLTFGGTFNNNGSAIRVYSTGGHDVQFNGVISGGGGLTLDGNTIVHLNNAHTYSGNTTVNAGTLLFETGGTAANSTLLLGNTSGSEQASILAVGGTYGNNITVRSGNNGTMTIGQSGNGNAVFTGAVTLQKAVTLTASLDKSAEFSGAFSGNQALTIDGGGGKVILSGAANNDFSSVAINAGFVDLNKTPGVNAIDSDITINGGSLTLLSGNQIANTANMTLNSGTFSVNSQSEIINSFNSSVDTTLTLGYGTFGLAGSSHSAIYGAITGSEGYLDDFGDPVSGARFFNTGSGSIAVYGSNTGMQGDWYASNGTISYNHNNAAGSGIIYLGNSSGANGATIDIGTSDVNLGNAIIVRSGSTGVKTINNATASGSRAVTYSGAITLNNSVNVDASTGETITLAGIVSGTGGMVKRGFGNTILTRINTFSGGMFIDEGKLTIGSGGDLTAVTTIDIGSTLYNGGAGNAEFALASGAGAIDRNIAVKAGSGTRTISSTGNNTLSGTVDLDKNLTVSSASGTLTLSGTVDLSNSGNNELTVNGAGGVTMSGNVTGNSGAAKLIMSGSGTLTLSGNNAGSLFMLDINSGSVALNHANALGSAYSDKVNFLGTGNLNVNASVGPADLGIRVADGAIGTMNVSGANVFSVATLESIGSAGTLTKSGTGTMVLNGDSSAFEGTFNLTAGTLKGVATIGGDFVQTGGTFAPGNSPGTFSILGDATWTGGTYLWETLTIDSGVAGSDWDLVDISGSLLIGSGYTVNIDDLDNLAGWDPVGTYSWLIAAAGGGVTGFENLGLNVAGWNINATDPAQEFSLRLEGNQIYLDYGAADIDPPDPDPGPSSVPEPNTLSFVMLAGLVLFSLRVRVRRLNRPPAVSVV